MGNQNSSNDTIEESQLKQYLNNNNNNNNNSYFSFNNEASFTKEENKKEDESDYLLNNSKNNINNNEGETKKSGFNRTNKETALINRNNNGEEDNKSELKRIISNHYKNNTRNNNKLNKNDQTTSLIYKSSSSNEDIKVLVNNAINKEKEEMMKMEDNFSFTNKLLNTFYLLVVFLLIDIKDIIIYLFIKKDDSDPSLDEDNKERLFTINKAFAKLSILYHIIFNVVPYSLTQGLASKAAEFYASKNYYTLNIMVNKSLFTALVSAILLSFLLVFFFGPYLALLSDEKQIMSDISTMFLWLSLGTLFGYVQIVTVRYLNAIDKAYVSFIASITGLLTQIVFLIPFNQTENISPFSIAMSMNLNNIVTCAIQHFYILIFNPIEQVQISFSDGVLDDYFNYFKFILYIGLVVFIPIISLDGCYYLGLIRDDDTFIVLNYSVMILIASYFLFSGMTSASNIVISYAIGLKLYSNIRKCFYDSFIIFTFANIILSVSLIIAYDSIGLFFTQKEKYLVLLNDYKIYFIISLILINYHTLINETLTVIGDIKVSLLSLFVGRVVLTAIFAIILFKATNLKGECVFIGFIAGQSVTMIINFVYLGKFFLMNDEELQKKFSLNAFNSIF